MSNATPSKKPTSRTIAKDKLGRFDPRLDDHFLADRSLLPKKVENLLLSASFGANSVLYAVFLGYLMGLWAFIVQFAWMLSFFLLARFTKQIHQSVSLHEFLGEKFGTTTRKLAALCSVIGITYFIGWEVAIANSALQSTTVNHTAGTSYGSALLFLAILVAIFYSSKWGRRASGSVNVWLNLVKIICLTLLLALLGYSFIHHGYSLSVLLPQFTEAIIAVGIVGLVTNIIFNVSWQFVDNSSWQSISSACTKQNDQIARSTRHAGVLTLLTVNGVGTLLGALLRPVQGVDSTNALGQIVQSISSLQPLAIITMVVLIVLSAISLFDGAILSISQSLVVDLGMRRRRKLTTVKFARVITLLAGVFSAWGVERIIVSLGGSIFDMVYIVILTQLCLIGPVLVGLTQRRHSGHMWASIAISLTAAIFITFFGVTHNDQTLLQLAGTIISGVSLASGYGIYLLSNNRRVHT